ncbi:MAG: class I SAM-dependent methyltransferase [Chloroflexi bacterium]|nr:class I SAM-dependent methyltransferase [Chloroflexota bacterium]MCI0645240.1 class I SAM-dependent methyltransferase [Chloroflexota bacterium]MCI0725312.1 class I SAM-dependent methyltransferase [Chloroflexota bacterium]
MSTTVIKNAKRRLALLQKYQPQGRLLDVGCGQGNFLSIANHLYQGIGVDISEYAVRHGREALGLDLRSGDFLTMDFAGTTFELITMWDFIAHVLNPCAYLEKAYDLLSPNGFLVLTTGDIGSVSARLSGKRWHLMIPPKHLHFFSTATIRQALERSGFRNIVIMWPGKYVPLEFILTKLGRMVDWVWLEKQKWPRFLPQALYVNLFDIMTVLARR